MIASILCYITLRESEYLILEMKQMTKIASNQPLLTTENSITCIKI